jgi:hypothetical protein
MKYKIAVLDDYQNAALESADWSVIRDRADITVFQDHLNDIDAVTTGPSDGRNECSLLLTDRPWQRSINQLTTGERNVQARNQLSFTMGTNPSEIQPSCPLV